MLQDFAEHLLSTFRDSDVVARLGGDEFCVLLSGATQAEIPRPLALLRARRNENDEPIVPFSVGAATYDPRRHKVVADLVAEADAEMYRQKGERRASRRTPGRYPPH